MATPSKPSHDVFGLGLGLVSWIFPDVSIGIKLTVSAIVVGLILFPHLDKTKRDRALDAVANVSDNILTNFLIPFIGGGFRGLFVALILIVILEHFFHVPLIYREKIDMMNPGPQGGGIVQLFLHTLTNLNPAGTAIVIIAVTAGAFSKVEDARKIRHEILLNSVVTEYTFATFKGTRRFLWVVSLLFEFSYNEKTYIHREYGSDRLNDLPGTLHRIKFYPGNPKIAKIVWDKPAQTVSSPVTGDSTKSISQTS